MVDAEPPQLASALLQKMSPAAIRITLSNCRVTAGVFTF
jgi:hypothetical protein